MRREEGVHIPAPFLSAATLDENSVALARQRARVFCAGIALPLLTLLALGDQQLALFGSLAGLVVGLSDAQASMLRRVEGALVVLAAVSASAGLGVLAQGNETVIIGLTLLLATLASSVPPQHRALGFVSRYSAVAFNIGTHQSITSPHLMAVFGLAGALACALVALDARFFPHAEGDEASMRAEFEQVRGGERNSLIFAICAGAVVALGLWVADREHLARPYWVLATIIFVMHPDTASSFRRIAERAVGVVIGALATTPFVDWIHSVWPLAAVVVVAAFFTPLALPRWYWLGSALITLLVLTLGDISSLSPEGSHVYLWVRVTNTLLGCAFAAAGTAAAWGLTSLRRGAQV